MKYYEFKVIKRARPLKEGARIQHAEDIVFWEGSKGAMRALEAIKNLEKGGHKDVTVKWDGSPAIIFGRDSDGNFILTDKSGFTAKGYDGRARSPEDLENMLLNRSGGKNREKPSYVAFAAKMKDIFDEYEKAVPKDYRGFFKGDLLYFNTPEQRDGNYVFKPNIVEYAVDANSELGKKIGRSKTGVVIHREVDAEGNEGPLQSTDIFQGQEVLVVPPVSVERPAQIPNEEIKQLESIIRKNAAGIDELLNPVALKEKQLSDFADILYTYTNSKVDTGLSNLGADFAKWLEARPQISDKKKVKVLEYVKEHANAFNALWQTVSTIMKVKDDIVRQFDTHDAQVKQNIPGHGDGGEGYVLAHPGGDIKLVPREFFTKANRAVNREGIETMKVNDIIKENDEWDLDDPMAKDDDSITNFKQEAMQVQLMKISDSEDHPDIKNPVRTVKTDDGKEMRVEHGEAVAILKLLQMNMKPQTKIQIMKDMQESAGLQKIIDFVNKQGMVK